jgi:hypothetical protein
MRRDYELIRDTYGRIMGKIDEFYIDVESFWVDHKELNVRFPEYKGDRNGEVKTYHISELKNK